MTTSNIGLIYAGGTFGSHGTPLAPLNKETFLGILSKKLSNYLVTPLTFEVVKDSSTLTPDDFFAFYRTIIANYQNGIQKILIITGTDTLAYLSAFLHYALQSINISVVVTGSMQPLLYSDNFEINPASDAWDNLTNGIKFLNTHQSFGTFVSFAGQLFVGNSVQKINASDNNAFVGDLATFSNSATNLKPNIVDLNTPINCPIHSIFALPNHTDTLASQLEEIVNQPPTALLLIGFGAGNLANSPNVTNAINTLIQKGFLVIMTSQCPFGERSPSYAAGAWQYELGILSGGNLPIAALYGQALWLCLSESIPTRKSKWTI